MKVTGTVLCVVFISCLFGQDRATVTVDLDKELGPMTPVWAWFGYDEPNYTYMKDGKKLLSEIAALSPVPVHVRTHNLMTSGDGTPALKWGSTNMYTEDAQGNPVYDWRIIDRIFDTYIERGMKPLAQMGFMPEALSTNPRPYKHDWSPGQPYKTIVTGWAYPPKDYVKWGELVCRWVSHCVERYGAREVDSWYWELWNEPDGSYWQSTVEEYCKLYDYTADAVKRALPSARIGGPHVTGPANPKAADFLRRFLRHCIADTNRATGQRGAPLDFIAFHAKGSPRIVNGHVRMNMGAQLRSIAKGFEIVSSFPEVSRLPVIIGESDPEGCAACGMHTNPENAYRNGTMYSSYTAASFARKYALADRYGIRFIGAVTWAFEFENQPWFYGYRDLATNGVDKPVLNVFRMFGMMSGTRVETSGSHFYPVGTVCDSSIRGIHPDIGALASEDTGRAAVMVWNYHDDDVPGLSEDVSIHITGIPAARVKWAEYRIDRGHSNAYETWKTMGSPQDPSPGQIAALEKTGRLERLGKPRKIRTVGGKARLTIPLPRQGVSLLVLEW